MARSWRGNLQNSIRSVEGFSEILPETGPCRGETVLSSPSGSGERHRSFLLQPGGGAFHNEIPQGLYLRYVYSPLRGGFAGRRRESAGNPGLSEIKRQRRVYVRNPQRIPDPVSPPVAGKKTPFASVSQRAEGSWDYPDFTSIFLGTALAALGRFRYSTPFFMLASILSWSMDSDSVN